LISKQSHNSTDPGNNLGTDSPVLQGTKPHWRVERGRPHARYSSHYGIWLEERTSRRIVHLAHLRLTGNNESKNPLRGWIVRSKVMTTVMSTHI